MMFKLLIQSYHQQLYSPHQLTHTNLQLTTMQHKSRVLHTAASTAVAYYTNSWIHHTSVAASCSFNPSQSHTNNMATMPAMASISHTAMLVHMHACETWPALADHSIQHDSHSHAACSDAAATIAKPANKALALPVSTCCLASTKPPHEGLQLADNSHAFHNRSAASNRTLNLIDSQVVHIYMAATPAGAAVAGMPRS